MTVPPQPPLPYYTPATPPPEQPRKSSRRGVVAWVLFIGLCVLLFMLLSQRAPAQRGQLVPLSEFTTRLTSGQVRRLSVGSDEIRGEFNSAQSLPGGQSAVEFRTPLPPGAADSWPFIEWLLANRGGAVVSVESQSQSLVANILLPVIPWLLIFGFIWFFVFRQLRHAGRSQQVVITGPGRWVPDPPAQAGPASSP